MPRNVIFLHGGPGFSNYLEPFFKNLDPGVNAIFYDQLKGIQVSVDDLVHQLDCLVNSLDGPVTLVGHSWGATLATEYVSRFEQKISSLVLISSGLNFNHWKKEFDLEKENRGLQSAPPESIFLSEAERGEWSGFLDKMWENFSEETFQSLYDGYIVHHDLTQKFSSFKLPILTISGSEDVRFPPRIAKTLEQFNPQIVQFEVQGAGHFPFLLEHHRKTVIDKIIHHLDLT